jgi:N,N-dimethylformamidase
MTITRRSFLVHCGTLIAGAALHSCAGQVDADSSASTASDSIDVVGYSNRMSVYPGDEIEVKINSQGMPYYSEMVRLQYAWDTLISLPVDEIRLRPAQTQPPIPFGSYMRIEGNTAALDTAGGVSMVAWIRPRRRPGPEGRRALFSKGAWNGPHIAVFVEAVSASSDWLLGFRVNGDTGAAFEVYLDGPLRNDRWYFVAATYDWNAAFQLYMAPVEPLDAADIPRSEAFQVTPGRGFRNTGPLLLGAAEVATDALNNVFHGQVSYAAFFDYVLDGSDIGRLGHLASGTEPSAALSQLNPLALWNLTEDGARNWIVGTAQVADLSGHGCNGILVNLPATAVTGHNFDIPYDENQGTPDFHDVPTKYNAVYFHEDDMEDAGWTTSFVWRVPPTIEKSGVYAARVARSGQPNDLSYYIPFVIGPRPDSDAPLLFIAPTFTWVAYANTPTATGGAEPEPWNDIWNQAYGNRGAYCRHSDGSPNYYGSSLRPMPRIVPLASSTTALDGTSVPSGISLGRDLFFTYWLDTYLQSRHGFSVTYDVMGDEGVHAIGRNVLERGDNGLLRYPVVVTGAHPEYWTDEMRIAVADYVQRGGHLMYLSGNGQYWVTSVDSARQHILEVRKRVNVTYQSQAVALPGEYHHSTTGQLGGLWRDVGHAPQELFGVGYACGYAEAWGTSYPLTAFFRLNPAIPSSASFIVKDVRTTDFLGAGYGPFGQSALSDEVDRHDTRLGSLPDTTVIATGQWQPNSSLRKDVLPEDLRDFETCHPDPECAKSLLRADVVYFRKGAGEVFAAGSRLWTAALMDTHEPNDFSTITANVLKHFLNR